MTWSEIARLLGLRWRQDVLVADRANFTGSGQTFTQGPVCRKVEHTYILSVLLLF